MDIKKIFSAPALIIDEKVREPNGDLIGHIKGKLIQNNIQRLNHLFYTLLI